MNTLQFRDYIFRHNPQSITVTDGSLIAEHVYPGKGAGLQALGRKARRIRCAGCFFGADARDAMQQASEFRVKTGADQRGMLFAPGMEPIPARLLEFVMEAQGDGRILPYTITFIEEVSD